MVGYTNGTGPDPVFGKNGMVVSTSHQASISGIEILKKGGKFYFSVPIGPQRIEFDAHRVFSISYLLELFDNKYHIDHFSYVDDKGNLHENELITDKSKNDNFNCNYGCGIFEMTKL